MKDVGEKLNLVKKAFFLFFYFFFTKEGVKCQEVNKGWQNDGDLRLRILKTE